MESALEKLKIIVESKYESMELLKSFYNKINKFSEEFKLEISKFYEKLKEENIERVSVQYYLSSAKILDELTKTIGTENEQFQISQAQTLNPFLEWYESEKINIFGEITNHFNIAQSLKELTINLQNKCTQSINNLIEQSSKVKYMNEKSIHDQKYYAEFKKVQGCLIR